MVVGFGCGKPTSTRACLAAMCKGGYRFECRVHIKHKLELHPPHEPPEILTDAITAVVGSQLNKTVHAMVRLISKP